MFKPKGIMLFSLIIVLMVFACSGPESEQPLLTAELPLHLEEHLDDARIEGSEVPEDLPVPIEWRFDEPQPDWKPAKPIPPNMAAVKPIRIEDALRLPLTIKSRIDDRRPRLLGAIHVALPDLNIQEWAHVEICARTQDPCLNLGLDFNYGEDDPIEGDKSLFPFYSVGDRSPLITDGTVQTYRLSLDHPYMRKWDGPWTDLGFWFNSQDNEEAVTLDILSVSVIPKEHIYADAPAGVRTVECSQANRRTLYTHAPGSIEYRVRIPQNGRLDVGLGVLRENMPVTFRVSASRNDKEEVALFEETYANQKQWAQRSVDLSSMTGKTVRIALETDADQPGTVGLWTAPTISGLRKTKKPNVIFYIIDGGGADLMSVYGYNRRTTPHLERLAAEGALFENAYSNCTWTKVSNSSFMTSLYHSVLGGHKSDADPLPDQAVTMAQHLHRAGYQTAVFTANCYAGRMTSFDRGVDVLRDIDFTADEVSSQKLHEHFWSWRLAYPSEPYWVHFQTSDVHGMRWQAPAPFSGLFISPEQRQSFSDWQHQMSEAGSRYGRAYSGAWEKTGLSPQAFSHARQGLYDETMAHNDYQIGQLVRRLKATGEWDHTLLIIAADHAHQEAGLMQIDPLPPKWGSPLFASFRSRIPMIFIWPDRIAPGQRLSQPVSLVDMLPTILDLADLPMPEMMQGQSLAPLLLGESGWESRPVILDECYVDRENGELTGYIEVVDGQWGASLEINGGNEYPEYVPQQRPEPMLLFDIWNDPFCLVPLNDKYPDLVEKYTKFLEERWEIHQALAKHFTRSKNSLLTPEQLETLRALGYIK